MAKLIALLSSGKGSWAVVNALLKASDWEHVYLVCNEYSHKNFEVKNPQKVTKLVYDEKKPVESMQKLSEFFKKNVQGIDVALNISSGTGIEHMALVSAVLRAGFGVVFVYTEFDELKTFEIVESQLFTDEDDNYGIY